MDEDILGLRVAIEQTHDALRRAFPTERLRGYALYTDDDLMTVGYLAVTQEVLDRSEDPDLLFGPQDWPWEPLREAFDAPSRALRAMYEVAEAEDFNGHVDQAFGLLVEALAEARREGLFGDDVYLVAFSTDPGPYLEALEDAAAARLNAAPILEARARFVERWS